MLTPADVAQLRRLLLQRGQEIADILAELTAGRTVSAPTLFVAAPGETDRVKLRRYLRLILSRLGAIEEGTYGACEGCGQALSYEELTALPWLDRCQACAVEPAFRGRLSIGSSRP